MGRGAASPALTVHRLSRGGPGQARLVQGGWGMGIAGRCRGERGMLGAFPWLRPPDPAAPSPGSSRGSGLFQALVPTPGFGVRGEPLRTPQERAGGCRSSAPAREKPKPRAFIAAAPGRGICAFPAVPTAVRGFPWPALQSLGCAAPQVAGAVPAAPVRTRSLLALLQLSRDRARPHIPEVHTPACTRGKKYKSLWSVVSFVSP